MDVGKPLRASRDSAKPTVPDSVLKRWAEEQADLVPRLWATPKQQSGCAQYIRLCGGSTKGLPVAIYGDKWVSANDIMNMTDLPDEVMILDHFTIEFDFRLLKSYTLEKTVFVTSASGIPGLLGGAGRGSEDYWPRGIETNFVEGSATPGVTLAGAVVEAVAAAWKVSFQEVSDVNNLDKEVDVLVGREGDRELRTRAIRVTRPNR